MADKDTKHNNDNLSKKPDSKDEAALAVDTESSKSSNAELKVEESKAKFLSPGQMVLKRFFRSRLSVIGLVTLVILFAFSFLGPFLSSWEERVPDSSQGKTSILDRQSNYNEVILSYDGLKYLMENLSPADLVELEELGAKETDDEKFKLKRNLATLYTAYAGYAVAGKVASFKSGNETVYFEIVKSSGQTTVYILEEVDGHYVRPYNTLIQRSETAKDLNLNANPSIKHWLGTDSDGYDIFTRLMYGGRISLTLGFVVVFIETLLAMLFGGLAGYFGKWIDNIIMRVIDILYCLPNMPIMLIFSAVLDGMAVDEGIRIYLLMGMLAIIGWAGMARVIRGQILYLREQEYMVACEALGLGVPRRIIKHLIPNVMPLLIVQMTLGLGSIILTESTLSYLGLGIRPPAAAWGTMISSADDPIILQNYPNQWIPAGIMIVLAVLAFNFVGDGLRDAFDPKARR